MMDVQAIKDLLENEFIQSAAISLISVIAGSLLTLLSTHVSSRRAADSQIKTAAINAFISAKIDAYKELEIAIEKWSLSVNNETTKAAVLRAANVASLVASDEVIAAIGNVQEMILDFSNISTAPMKKDFKIARLELLEKMHADLLVYPTPNAVKTKKAKRRGTE